MPKASDEVDICDEGGKGLFLPAGGKWESDLPDPFRAFVYFIALSWCFLGVAIVADIFMSAIETITSKKARVWDKSKQRYRTVKVWNDTVANLTLMALGSSAPEILLSVIELFKEEFYSGELGPGTIVGSAAFNLLGITAVCVASIPSSPPPGIRYIKDVSVYTITAVFSMFAYVWLLIILVGPSPNMVTVGEGIITFLFFPVLVCTAFLADRGYFGIPTHTKQRVVAAEMTKDELGKLVNDIRKRWPHVDDGQIAVLVEKETAAQRSKAGYRTMTGMKSFRFSSMRTANEDACPCIFQSAESHPCGFMDEFDAPTNQQSDDDNAAQGIIAYASFMSSNFAVCESDGSLTVSVARSGNKNASFRVKYRTLDGTAKGAAHGSDDKEKAGKDFIHSEGVLEFGPGVKSQNITVHILDDTEWETAEDFSIELFDPLLLSGGDSKDVQLQPIGTTTVTIIDDDDPGCLCFSDSLISVSEELDDVVQKIDVSRKQGCRGKVSCSYRTENASAIAPLDFEENSGVLEFENGQTVASIELRIKARGRYDHTESFRLVIFDAKGCRFCTDGDGDEKEQTMWIEITPNADSKNLVDQLSNVLSTNWAKARLGKSEWQDQFVEAIYVGGSKEEQDEAGALDWIYHLIALPWKLVFACVPPADFHGGWSCFVAALTAIGGLTAVVGDLASLLGCCLQMPQLITAITFVALGTSLPDTFASKTAAQQDPYADASIGNITGSNSVNVFLGLGLPWTIGAIYWSFMGATDEWKDKYPEYVGDYPDGGFIVVAEGLDFSVAIFVTSAVTCMAVLFIRRKLFGGELGGPYIPKVASAAFLVLLWVGYIGTSWAYYIITNE